MGNNFRLIKNNPISKTFPCYCEILIMEKQLLYQNKHKIKQRSIKGYLCNVNDFLFDPCFIIKLRHPFPHDRFITEIARHHKKERHTKTADCLHCNACYPRKLAMHEYNKNTSNAFDVIKAIVILICSICHSDKLIIKKHHQTKRIVRQIIIRLRNQAQFQHNSILQQIYILSHSHLI